MKQKRKRWSIEEVKEFLNEFNYVLISEVFTRTIDKLDMICESGHECSISFSNFKIGKGVSFATEKNCQNYSEKIPKK